MRLVHLSDIHLWRYDWRPRRLLGKRAWGMLALARGRARRFRLERLADVVARVRSLEPDYTLITGDLTTTALPEEFDDALTALAPLLDDPDRVSVLPGNHDRYTPDAVRERRFETAFDAFLVSPHFPWIRHLDARTRLLALDPTRYHLTARGFLPPSQIEQADALLATLGPDPGRLIVACHYPAYAPPGYARQLAHKRLANQRDVRAWLATLPPHLYCCGHVHAAWAYAPPDLPTHLSLNAGAPLLRDPTGRTLPGFLEITLDADSVQATHHAWTGTAWTTTPLAHAPNFFRAAQSA
jgi:3',5'-cyclic AMP phosphodiesterase CpdA